MTEPRRSWQEKYRELSQKFPEIENVDWGIAFRRDPSLFTSILNDLIKAEGRGSLPGKRPQLPQAEALDQLKKITQSDFSHYDFYTTFDALVGNRSVRSVSNKTGLGKSFIYQLLKRERIPSFEAMEKIAKGFKKDPSFFLEYRNAIILAHLDSFLFESPEISVTWFLKINKESNRTVRIS